MFTENTIEACTIRALGDVVGVDFEDGGPWHSFWRETLCESDREDALQEVRLAVWEALEDHDPTLTDGPAQTHAIKRGGYRLRKWLNAELRRRETGGAVHEPTGDRVAAEANPLDACMTVDMAQLAAGAARHLPSQEAEAIRLRFGLDGDGPLKHSEVAEQMGISCSLAWKLVEDGLRRLRAELRVDEILSD